MSGVSFMSCSPSRFVWSNLALWSGNCSESHFHMSQPCSFTVLVISPDSTSPILKFFRAWSPVCDSSLPNCQIRCSFQSQPLLRWDLSSCACPRGEKASSHGLLLQTTPSHCVHPGLSPCVGSHTYNWAAAGCLGPTVLQQYGMFGFWLPSTVLAFS